MYVLIVVALMFVLPLASIGVDHFGSGQLALSASLVGKWFVFWAVGVRLLTAGLRQMARPQFTAHTILGIHDPRALVLVRELGFGNTAMGAIGVSSLAAPGWTVPAAVAGAIFLGLAGINHALQKPRGAHENLAMVSDLFVALVLAACCLL